jgi:NTE family protein
MNVIAQQPPNALYTQTALVLQGGGALGAYQAGVYECLEDRRVLPNWVAGISIGAINAAMIAGNRPGERVRQLRTFWDRITEPVPDMMVPLTDTMSRRIHATVSGLRSLLSGIPGFFSPRLPAAWLQPPGGPGATSYYDTGDLHATLKRHVDFDLINSGAIRLSLGAVNIRTGNFTCFDSRNMEIGPEHVMASAALPPGFPPVEIDGEYYWDGGLVSNTPLSYVLNNSCRDTLMFQVDLFSAVGPYPETIDEVEERRKDIVYSSRTRMNTDIFREKHTLKQAITQLAERLPPGARTDPVVAELAGLGGDHKATIVHLIYRRTTYGGPAKDYEFSRRSMVEHWKAGKADARRTLRARAWREPPPPELGIAVYDMTRSGVA